MSQSWGYVLNNKSTITKEDLVDKWKNCQKGPIKKTPLITSGCSLTQVHSCPASEYEIFILYLLANGGKQHVFYRNLRAKRVTYIHTKDDTAYITTEYE